jgi:hypothetical protein
MPAGTLGTLPVPSPCVGWLWRLGCRWQGGWREVARFTAQALTHHGGPPGKLVGRDVTMVAERCEGGGGIAVDSGEGGD